jgi:hypothetical protein
MPQPPQEMVQKRIGEALMFHELSLPSATQILRCATEHFNDYMSDGIMPTSNK